MRARLLIVDDEEPIREIMTSMLSPQGYEIVRAEHGEEALAILNSEGKFDLVISDIMMPRVDGIMLLQAIKKQYPKLPVLIASPVCDKDVIKRTYELGACAYLMEPFERYQLLDAVSSALATSTPATKP